jgi:Xaa-Pro aminopeptidase
MKKSYLAMIKPGVNPMDLWDMNNDYLRSHGYTLETRLYAHGQGYDLVERPSFQIGEQMEIMENMNIAVHPVVASSQATAIICDNYIVGKNGVGECLHKLPKEIFVV